MAADPSTTPPCWDTQGLFPHLSPVSENSKRATQIVIECLSVALCYRQVCLFLKRGANQNAADIDEKTPLTVAVEAANADIVTL